MTTPTFTGMHIVAVPVTDQERTKALFEQLGLHPGLDTELQPGFSEDCSATFHNTGPRQRSGTGRRVCVYHELVAGCSGQTRWYGPS